MLKPSPDLTAATERAELFFRCRPGSPSAVRRPRLLFRSGKWIALLGNSRQDGIMGEGRTVEEALREFDSRYLEALHPPKEDQPRPAA